MSALDQALLQILGQLPGRFAPYTVVLTAQQPSIVSSTVFGALIKKVDSYSNFKCFFIALLPAHSHFWGQELLSDRSISKRYPNSYATLRVIKSSTSRAWSSTSRAFHACDTWFYWSSENAVHERFITEQWHWVWMEACSSSLSIEKTLSVRVWIQFYTINFLEIKIGNMCINTVFLLGSKTYSVLHLGAAQSAMDIQMQQIGLNFNVHVRRRHIIIIIIIITMLVSALHQDL